MFIILLRYFICKNNILFLNYNILDKYVNIITLIYCWYEHGASLNIDTHYRHSIIIIDNVYLLGVLIDYKLFYKYTDLLFKKQK